MKESPERSFGLLIAYLAPGFVCLAGASHFSATLASWMSVAPADAPTVGGFLYVATGSFAAGLVVNAVRWALIDKLLHASGLVPPKLDFSRLQANLDAFQLAVEHNYRYYQFYASMALAAAFYSLADHWAHGRWPAWILASFAMLEIVMLVTSRDCLKRYYDRTRQMLSGKDVAAPNAAPG